MSENKMEKRPNYEKGGKVRVSGEWYEIKEINASRTAYLPVKVDIEGCWTWIHENLIEEYDQPISDYCEWLRKADLFHMGELARINTDKNVKDFVDKFHKHVNKALIRKYGMPTKLRVYNGEKPEVFGLEPDSKVFMCGYDKVYDVCFSSLKKESRGRSSQI